MVLDRLPQQRTSRRPGRPPGARTGWRSPRRLVPASRTTPASGSARPATIDSTVGCRRRSARMTRPPARLQPGLSVARTAPSTAIPSEVLSRSRRSALAADALELSGPGQLELVPVRADGGSGGHDGRGLVGQHGRRNVGVLQRERPAEPAAGLRLRQVEQLQALDLAQQPQRSLADPEQAQRVACRVVRSGCAGTRRRRRLTRGRRAGPPTARRSARPPSGRGPPARDRPPGRPGRRAGGAPIRRTTRWGPPRRRTRRGRRRSAGPAVRRGRVAGVGVHLPAAGLLERHRHVVPEPRQQPVRRPAHVGEQRVGQAGDEQRDPHAHSFTPDGSNRRTA